MPMIKLYGTPPVDLGLVDLSPVEMMFWQYCPIKLPGSSYPTIPDNLYQFEELVHRAYLDSGQDRWKDSYVYLTAKTLYVTPENPGNRPGWHSDGFMTDDLNYIWSDRCGTEFWVPPQLYCFTQDHHESLPQMELAGASGPVVTYPDKHLLRLDEFAIHRVAPMTPGFRSFVKVSVSSERYNLAGNSINHAFPEWDYVPRTQERNHPIGESK